MADTKTFGQGDFQYHVVSDWDRLPDGWEYKEVAGVATDSKDRVYVFNRGEHPLIVLDRDGKFLNSWGEGTFQRAHGIWVGPDDMLYLSDDLDHTVRKYTPEGELVMMLGKSGEASDTGIDGMDYRTIKQPGPPFHYPTNVALASDGSMYISDGYGNCRIHKFSPEGELLFSWGEAGDGPGQFNLPHGICLDSAGNVFVADRENNRLQVFSPKGEFIEEWPGVIRPCQIYLDSDDNVFVAEVGKRVGLFPWMEPDPTSTGGRVSVYSRQRELLSRWGGGDDPAAPGDFFAPHDIWIDSEGSVYVGEVTWSAGGKKGLAPPGIPSLQKFVRTDR
ncbi:MAG: peptidyl-alpha-hydroxyglycine alpha-amidating lyase family protein [Planctomycetes bacterium]|nr:peptidyl-alpha-hydroxyglycine alpha-amidating lyase family protein [Planctomycetota bacterium]